MKKRRGSVLIQLLIMALGPLLCLAILVIIIFASTFYLAMKQEVKSGLHSLVTSVLNTYNIMYEGDFILTSEGHIMKGHQDIASNYSVLDNIKHSANIDVTIFYQDTRILTTILNDDGERAIGTKAAPEVTDTVLGQGIEYFSSRVLVNGTKYFGYYIPIINSDNTIFGMAFVGKTTEDVLYVIYKSIYKIIVISIVVVIIATAFCIRCSKRIVITLHRIMDFLGKMSRGNLTDEIDEELIKRNDEIGEIGQYAKQVQASLRGLIETDSLTGLYNRRTANIKLEILNQKVIAGEKNVVLVIGDIDFFKLVNDKYGHECGDLVLKELSNMLQTHVEGKGFTARWGGEEFLIVYEGSTLREACEHLEELLDKVREKRIIYHKQVVKVTMTFGVAECNMTVSVNQSLKYADVNLYKGKESGRNKIVSDFYLE